MRKAVLCFLKKDDSVLMIHTDYGDKILWSGICGYIEEGESASDAAIREIKEEIGVNVSPENILFLGVQDDFFHIYTIQKWTGEPASKEQSIKELKWFPINSLPYDQMHERNENWLPKFLNKS